MTRFKVKPLVLMIAFAGQAVAQTPSNNEHTDEAREFGEPIREEVIVTGSYRDSLATALDAKREAAGSVDAIMAEDIGKFPDANLGEALQRLPGVSLSRSAGEGRNISVRGLGPEYTRVRINGMEALSTGGGTDAAGGANRGRGFDFNAFPSELFSSLIVRKTANAATEEGSLGATVDLRAARPFDFDGFTFSSSLQAGYNTLSEKVDPKASVVVSDLFADDRVGALLSLAWSERSLQDQGASTVRWAVNPPFGAYQGLTAGEDFEAISSAFHPRLPRYDAYTHDIERFGASGSLQFRPSESSELSLDMLHANMEGSREELFLIGILNSSSVNAATNVLDYEIDSSNTLVYADLANTTVRSENRYDEMETSFTQVTLSGEHQISDDLRLRGLLGRAQSEFDNPVQTTVTMDQTGTRFSYDYRQDSREPLMSYGFDPTTTSGWAATSVRLRPLGSENTFDSAQLDLEWDFRPNISLLVGAQLKAYDFSTFEARRASENAAGIVLSPDLISVRDVGEIVGNNPERWAAADLDAIAQAYGIYSGEGEFALSTLNRRQGNYAVTEDTTSAYAQLNFDTEIGDVPLRGDLGVRHITTEQASTAWVSRQGEWQQVWVEHEYDELLPALNLVWELSDTVLLRASVAEVMARAGLSNLKSDTSISVSGGNRTVDSGNPYLEPTRATTFDFAIEIYPTDESLISLAVFKKDIDSFVQNLQSLQSFTATGLPQDLVVEACNAGPDGYGPECNESLLWNVSSPLNGPGGPLYGFELSYQQPFTFLPGIGQYFGFIGNYTYVSAELDYLDKSGAIVDTQPLTGLSDYSYSATLYYERDALQARVSASTRSEYLTRVPGRDGADVEGTAASTHLDFSASYALNNHWEVTVEGMNLTDEPEDQWVDQSAQRSSYYHLTGRQFYLGVQYQY